MKFFQRVLFSLLGYTLVFWILNLRFATWFGWIVQGSFSVEGGPIAYITLAILLSLINALIKPLLMLISFPLRWITLGLFSLVINAFLLWVLQMGISLLSLNVILHIEHWQTYILVGFILSLVNGFIHWFEK